MHKFRIAPDARAEASALVRIVRSYESTEPLIGPVFRVMADASYQRNALASCIVHSLPHSRRSASMGSSRAARIAG
jgi:hypothetical protein